MANGDAETYSGRTNVIIAPNLDLGNLLFHLYSTRYPEAKKFAAMFGIRFKGVDLPMDANAKDAELAKAWETVGTAGKKGPLDKKTCRLIKLALAMGAQQEGAVHASVRKGLAMGIAREELEQVVVLAAGTLGFPQTVAAYTWIKDLL